MAGSYHHVVDGEGRFIGADHFTDMIENLGDAYETIEEMYGMIWFLAGGNASRVSHAHRDWSAGFRLSPGRLDKGDT